ncbi:pyrroloquinoline-quinone synthase PqqC [Roseibium salinum]|uniref:Pyrroloquinoline-quinone synthase n=1 Tax=Roseibium salinum TaxID=1604349 RepID=A0ABT3R477_9HYPH|nr:pyrroloquinoline-quinone synthase PqqC [Roseibium sp. DSM 29163]MCX2724005.1 pyrroloquinoline-quinone synthase PqqC [Roseibium sp. DSM 29163]
MTDVATARVAETAPEAGVQSGVAPTRADDIRRAGRLLSPAELEAALREAGFDRYHIHHPFHKLMNAGDLTRAQMQAWALNRYCYQATIPKKDAIILSRSEDAAFRREWRKRIIDHDGDEGDENEGGVKRWLKLAEGLGLDTGMVRTRRHALPATRYAVGTYIDLVSSGSMLVAVASSLTELFSPVAIGERVPAMLARYDYITEDTLAYFRPRLHQAPRDAEHALALVSEWADTPDKQADAVDALLSKCDILWAMLDALYYAYVQPGFIPPGAFRPPLAETGR